MVNIPHIDQKIWNPDYKIVKHPPLYVKSGQQLGLPVSIFEAEQSRFFKQHYRNNWHNRGIMVREIDVIRSQEGW
jgi:hypothetical protein